jgi:F-type H+-transporting ATPase subunit epsilon
MTRPLHLTITTPAAVLVDAADVVAVRAEDESGGFGILTGHTDLLTVLPASVVRWRDSRDRAHFCALRGGVLRVLDGHTVAIACREGYIGDDLTTLEARVDALRATAADVERRHRVDQTRMHAHAVRQLIRLLGTGPHATSEMPLGREDAR